MTACSVIMNRDNRIDILFYHGTDSIHGSFLHFRIGTLHRIQLNGIGKFAGSYRRNRTASHTNTIIIASQHYHFISFHRMIFQAVLLATKTNASGQHDHFIISPCFLVLCMFEGKDRTTNKRLAKLVTEITGSVGGFGKNLLRSLV